METNSNNCVGSLTYSFSYNVVIYVFNSASVRAKLILLTSFTLCGFVAVLVFLYLVG